LTGALYAVFVHVFEIMPRLVTERIKELRQEITQITEANRKYLRDPKYGSAVAASERRFQDCSKS
jgi:hypothetical protein